MPMQKIRLKDNLCRSHIAIRVNEEQCSDWLFEEDWGVRERLVELEEDVVLESDEVSGDFVVMIIGENSDSYDTYFHFRGSWWVVLGGSDDDDDQTERDVDLYIAVRDDKLPLKYWYKEVE